MIDTIKIITDDFQIDYSKNQDSNYPLGSVYATKNHDNRKGLPNIAEHIFMEDVRNLPVYGDYLTLQSTDHNPKGTIRDTGIVQLKKVCLNGIEKRFFLFNCSMPKLLHGDNFHTANHADVALFQRTLQKTFDDMGIYLDVSSAKVSRLDTTRNVETKYSFSTYLPVLKMNHARRMREQEINAETWTIGNTQRQLCCYDKVQEIINDCRSFPPGISAQSNIFRCENRLLKKQACVKKAIQTVSELYKNYEDVKAEYKKDVEKMMFSNYTSQEKSTSTDIQEIMQKAYKKNATHFAQELFFNAFIADVKRSCDFRTVKALQQNKKVIGAFIEEQLKNEGFEGATLRQRKSRMLSKLEKESSKILCAMGSVHNISYDELFTELYQKLILN